MPRLFIALPAPSEFDRLLNRLAIGLPATRWLAAGQRHITLRFIGETDDHTFQGIGETLTRLRATAVDIQLDGIGCLPKRGSPKILYAGIKSTPELTELRRNMNQLLRSIDIEPDPREFIPHITLARFKSDVVHPRLVSYLQKHAMLRSKPVIESTLHLYSSRLQPNGAEYRIEATYDFVTGSFEQF